MKKKVLYGIIVSLAVIALIVGGTILIYDGISKGLADITGETEQPGKNTGIDVAGNNGGGESGKDSKDDGKDEKPTPTPKPERTDEEKKELFLSKLDSIMAYIDYYYYEEIDDDEIYDAMLHSALYSLGDPYSTYYSPDEYNLLLESSSGTYSGIGATVSQSVETGKITIVKPFIDSPAMKAGVLPGDEIIKVDGVSIEGLDLNEVVSHLKGLEGTKVNVTFLRDEKEIEIVITRGKIVVQFVSYRMLEDNIGYIMVSEFEETTAAQFKDAIAELSKQGMKGLVVDLRDNPGGLVSSVCEMLDRIAPKGSLLVYTEDKYGHRLDEYAETEDTLDVPLVVLMNGNSASASEIFAGAVQDLGLGKIVGTQSFGKGIVQSVIPIIQDLSGIKVTSSRYFTPKGVCIHGIGITPDVEVELDEDLKKTLIELRDHDNQIDKARETVKGMK